MKTCVACGMLMRNKEDFALQDMTKDYCVHCAREDGTMHSFQEKVVSMTEFIIRTQGLEEAVAKKVAVAQLMELPLWKDQSL